MKITFSDLIVKYLNYLNVKYVFGVPGTPVGGLLDALKKSKECGGAEAVLTAHETGAAFMADGISRESNTIGVCFSTTGPGATNLITGVGCAYTENIPLLVITPQTDLADFGSGSFQDSSADFIDITSMFKNITKYSTAILHPDQAERKLTAALTEALTYPRGPVHLSITDEVFRTEFADLIKYPNLKKLIEVEQGNVDIEKVSELTDLIKKQRTDSNKILFLIGKSCRYSGMEIEKFASALDASIITTPTGKSCINNYHPNYFGGIGFAGHKSARDLLTNNSFGLVIAIGTNLDDWSTSHWDNKIMSEKLVHIHNDRKLFARSPMAKLQISGNIKNTITHILKNIQPAPAIENYLPENYIPKNIEINKPEYLLDGENTGTIKTQYAIREIVKNMSVDSRYYVDCSSLVPNNIHYLFQNNRDMFNISIGFASMGWGIGASIGAAFSGNCTVCFTGDGCFLMNGNDISIAAKYRLPLLIILFNNNEYGMIKQSHSVKWKENADYSTPKTVDYCKVAEGLGVTAYRVENNEDFKSLKITQLLQNGPCLIEIKVDTNTLSPLKLV
jgi:acetolactate synthase I/II/III large subunit